MAEADAQFGLSHVRANAAREGKHKLQRGFDLRSDQPVKERSMINIERERSTRRDASLRQSLLHPLKRWTLPHTGVPIAICAQPVLTHLCERGKKRGGGRQAIESGVV